MGARGIVEGKRIILGNHALMQKYNVAFGAATVERVRQLEESGKTLLFLARENTQLAGMIATEDSVRRHARAAAAAIKKSGWRAVLVSGDNTSVVSMVGEAIGADEAVSMALPSNKEEVIKQYQGEGKTVAMIGAGESDMAAVIRSHIGIVLSSGEKIEGQHGQITIINGGLERAKTALELGRVAVTNALQSFGAVIIYTLVFTILASWGKIPAVAAPLFPAILNLAVILKARRINSAGLKMV